MRQAIMVRTDLGLHTRITQAALEAEVSRSEWLVRQAEWVLAAREMPSAAALYDALDALVRAQLEEQAIR